MLLLIVAALVVYLLFFSERERTISMTATPLTAGVTRLNTGSGLLYQTEGHIHYYDWNDQGRNYTEGTATEDIRMSGSTFLSVVYTPTMLQIVGQEQPVAFTGEVLSVECGREHIAVLRRDSEGGESILVLSATGEQVDQLLPDDQYIVDFGFYTTTGEMLWMQTISSASGTPTTRITTYDLQRRTGVGVMQVQDQLIDGLYFTENSVFAAGTSQIIRYTHDGNKEIYREMVYGYRVLDFSAARRGHVRRKAAHALRGRHARGGRDAFAAAQRGRGGIHHERRTRGGGAREAVHVLAAREPLLHGDARAARGRGGEALRHDAAAALRRRVLHREGALSGARAAAGPPAGQKSRQARPAAAIYMYGQRFRAPARRAGGARDAQEGKVRA